MRKLFAVLFVLFFAYPLNAQPYDENFDEASNWLGGSPGSYGAQTYKNDTLDPLNDQFTTNNGLRETSDTHSGAYAFRTKNTSGAYFMYECEVTVTEFSVWIARWDNSPKPNVTVEYSTDSGANWTQLATFTGDDFTGDKVYKKFTYDSFGSLTPDNGKKVQIKFTTTSGERMLYDDFYVNYTTSSSVAPPTGLMVNTTGTTSLDITWFENAAGDDVLLAYNTTDTFGNPVDGTSYSPGNAIPGGGTVIYVGGDGGYQHTGLSPNTTYYYMAWSVDASTKYSSGTMESGTTAKEEPSNHVTNFTATADDAYSITLSWTENDGAVVPDGYLILANTGAITDPNDTEDFPDDTDLTDDDGRVKVSHGTTTYTFSNCSPATTYNFKIYPYTNHTDLIDYKTDGTVPTASATTDAASPEYLIISEVADPKDNYRGRFVEISNIGSTNIDLSAGNYYICEQANGGTINDIQLSGTIAAGGVIVVALNQSDFNSLYGFDPDFANGYINGNGDDGYFLYKGGDHSTGTLIDSYGELNVAGNGQAWEYTDSRAYRVSTVTQARRAWNANEWMIEQANVADMTPGNYPEVDAMDFMNAVKEYDFVTSDHAGVKVNVTALTGEDAFVVKFYKGRGPKHRGGISESSVGSFGWHFTMESGITSITANLKFYICDLPAGSVTEGANQLKLYKRPSFGTGDFTLVGTLTYHDNGTAGNQSDDWLEYDGVTSFSEYVIAGNNGLTPVELVSFSAVVSGNEITLNWQTATEINNYGFQVERKKAKGESSWENIGFVEGAGNSNSPKEYSFTDNVTESGMYSYRLKQIDIDGSYEYSKVVEVNIGSPAKFELMQNYPNPFFAESSGNPTTTIKYSIPSVIARSEATKQSHDFASNVQLNVYNILGEEIATLVNEKQSPGNYSVQFDASNLPSGVYFYTLRVGDFIATKKMILLK